MKKCYLSILLLASIWSGYAQGIIGAWERNHVSQEGDSLKSVVIFAEGYQVITTYHAKTGKFIYTNGGTWTLDG